MNTKHTPGPWAFETPKEGTPDISIQTRIQTKGPHSKPGLTIPFYVARVYGTGEYFGPINQERLANAKLIAAAPELLECTKIAIGVSEWAKDHGADKAFIESFNQMLKKAIAKAEGRE